MTRPRAKTKRARPAAWSATGSTQGSKQGVDAYIRKLDGDSKAIVTKLRRLVLSSVPGLEEAMKWSTPVYSKNGLVCWLHVARSHAAIGFYQGASLADPQRLLEGTGKRLRHLKIRKAAEIRPAVITRWVRQAAALNAE